LYYNVSKNVIFTFNSRWNEVIVLAKIWLVFIIISGFLTLFRKIRGRSFSGHAQYNRNSSTANTSHTTSPYDVLGIDPNSPQEKVANAYHKLANEFHPDKLSSLSDELRKVAEEKMKEINWAYNQLKRNYKD